MGRLSLAAHYMSVGGRVTVPPGSHAHSPRQARASPQAALILLGLAPGKYPHFSIFEGVTSVQTFRSAVPPATFASDIWRTSLNKDPKRAAASAGLPATSTALAAASSSELKRN